MARYRVFQILEGDRKIIFIPDLQKLYLVDTETNIPDFVEDESFSVKTVKYFPDLKFNALQLIVNNICNLRCVYCYANAGVRQKQILPQEIAFAAIDKGIADVVDLGGERIQVGLIGGEPTCSMDLIEVIVSYIRKQAASAKISARICMVSNGIFNKDIQRYIINNFDYFTISLDGNEYIHNIHRPMTDKSGSFRKAFENAKAIYDAGIKFGLRSTVSQYSVENLPESIEFFHQHFPKALIGIEPLQECGRCLTTNALAPDMQRYADKMIEVLKIAKDKKIRIKTSFLRFKRTVEKLSFCGVNGRNFVITPEGYVTGCTRLISKQDCKSKDFYYGYYDYTNKNFVFDNEKYNSLKNFVVDTISECNDCFARFNCKGDCLSVKADCFDNFASSCSPRCEAIKKITLGMFKIQLGIL